MRRRSVTGVQEELPRSSETSRTKASLVAGQPTSSRPAGLRSIDKSGGRSWNEIALVTLPCGVTMVIGPDVASGGTMAVIRRSRLLLGALVEMTLAPLNRTPVA